MTLCQGLSIARAALPVPIHKVRKGKPSSATANESGAARANSSYARQNTPAHRMTICDTGTTMSVDPKSVKVNLTSGTGVDIEWTDGHRSSYTFPFLSNACPCAMCNEERETTGRLPGEAVGPKPGELPMFKPAAKPESAEGVGKYAIRFKWNDGHELGIYSWQWLRQICPCPTCKHATAKVS